MRCRMSVEGVGFRVLGLRIVISASSYENRVEFRFGLRVAGLGFSVGLFPMLLSTVLVAGLGFGAHC